MRPLVDADVLRYEVGAIGEGEDGPASFDFVAEVLDGRIRDICEAVHATEPPVLYLTGKNNFREEIAVTKPYKGNRKDAKPFHFDNLTAYMYNQYPIVIQDGLEADDLMCIEQIKSAKRNSRDHLFEYYEWGGTVICTRDKDLRMVPGWHYGWECGAQNEYGPVCHTDEDGEIELLRDKKTPKLVGHGLLFFYSQLLTGDQVDNIPGCPRVGPVKAYEVLSKDDGLTPYEKVKAVYDAKGLPQEYLMEQAHLLWMVRELTPEGKPVLWQPPN